VRAGAATALAGCTLAGAAALAAGPAHPDAYGTYRLAGRARVEARPFPAQEQEVHADAVLSAGAGPGAVRLRLAGEGLACDLSGTLAPDGALELAPGQRCATDLRSEEVEGRVEARLLSGSGRVRDDAMTLELDFALSGAVKVRSGGALDALTSLLPPPGAGPEPVPVRGQARGRAEGRRDHSRAAG